MLPLTSNRARRPFENSIVGEYEIEEATGFRIISSTYTDLTEERQPAVEAILRAGHIPAGMELFAAGDQSQMQVIKRWIEESDVFLPILGGRYGSLDQATNKSYIELEYEYAENLGKRLFAVVIDEGYLDKKVHSQGRSVLETENPQQLKAIRTKVVSRVVRFFSMPEQIRLAVMETLNDFARDDNLVGWIPGDQAVDTGEMAEELARLSKENDSIRKQLSRLGPSTLFRGLRKLGIEPAAHTANPTRYRSRAAPSRDQ